MMTKALAKAAAAGDGVESTTMAVGTRKSPLALAQTDFVVADLARLFPALSFPIHSMMTTGDRDQNTALYNFGGKGLWTSQLEERLVAGELDMVVHSLKDMPTTLPAGCVLGCVTRRNDARDTLVVKPELAARHGWRCLADLPAGSVVGTSSVRRIVQLARRYPGLRFKDVRGNIQTRLAKLDRDPDLAALVLAAAGLQRMGLAHCISQFLDADDAGMLHAIGQGALGVECRAADHRVLRVLRRLEHRDTALTCRAERSLMRALEGGCSAPIGVDTRWLPDGPARRLRLRATVVSADGSEAVDADDSDPAATPEAADELGRRVAAILVRRGADKILDAINATRPAKE